MASENVTLERDLNQYLFTDEEIKTISEEKVKNIKEEYEILETEFFYDIIELLKQCLRLNPSEFEVFYSSDFIKKSTVVNLVAFHPNKNTMERVAESLVDLCQTFRYDEKILPNPVNFFVEIFISQLGTILKYDAVQHTEYFNLLDHVIRLAGSKAQESFDAVDVSQVLHNTITSRKINENDDSQDSILSGCLLLIATLDQLFHSKVKQGCPAIYSSEFLQFMLSYGLFSREKPDPSNDELSYPLCKHIVTRRNALKLVSQVFGTTHMTDIAKYLDPIIKTGSWRTNKREKWNIQTSRIVQRKTHVGLVNLGCTCYMNSLMQQLFMCPYFKNFICSAKDLKLNEMPLEDNVLYHSKYLFANLIKSRSPSYNPIVFFNSIKDFSGEPMPTNEQRDVDEFLNIYMDKIEQNIKGGEDETHLKSIFGGAFAQELICKGCPHRSAREEPYLSVNLEIKNKSNIKEALDLFIQGEMLEGDNAYFCERCDKKVDTLKRCCIKKLPNTLILSLKRFEFDLETLSRYKLNSYCEFYDDLDMREYCQESLAKKELLKTMKEENLNYEMLTEDQKATYDYNLPDFYYKYKLKGTVIHYGTAEGGHYYSFIKERGTDKWYEFNDMTVRDYDPADLPEDAFGGKLKYEQKVIQSGKQYIQTEKLHNAYVLIYERDEYIDNDKLFELRETETKNLEQLLPTYTLPKKPGKIEPEILDDLISSYDKHWISNKMFDDSFIDSIIEMCLSSCTYLQLNTERALKQAMDVDDPEEKELYKLKFATLFLFGVVIRSESRLKFAEKILPQIRDTVARCSAFARWILKCFSRKQTINELFANCWSTQACRMLLGVLKIAIRKVYNEEKAEIQITGGSLEAIAQNLISLANDPTTSMPLTLRCLYEFIVVGMSKTNNGEMLTVSQFFYLGVLLEYANLDKDFRQILIAFKFHNLCISLAFNSCPTIDVLIPGIAFADGELENEMNTSDEVFSKNNIGSITFDDDDLGNFREFKLNKFEKVVISNLNKDFEPFLFEFKLMSKLMRSCEIMSEGKPEYETSEYRMDNPKPLGQVFLNDILGLTEPAESTCTVLFGSRCKNKALRNELGRMYAHLLYNDERSIFFCKTIITALNGEEFKEICHYERILFTVMTMNDSFLKERINNVLNLSIKLLDNNSSEYAFTDLFCGMMIKFAKRSRIFRKELYGHNLVDKINKWLGNNVNPPISSLRSSHTIFKSGKHNNRYSYDVISQELQALKDYNAQRKTELRQMHKKLTEFEAAEPESEDDLYDDDIEIGSKVDFMGNALDQWNSGVVSLSMGEILKVQKEQDDMEIDGKKRYRGDIWINKDDSDLARSGCKINSLKANVLNIYTKAYNS